MGSQYNFINSSSLHYWDKSAYHECTISLTSIEDWWNKFASKKKTSRCEAHGNVIDEQSNRHTPPHEEKQEEVETQI